MIGLRSSDRTLVLGNPALQPWLPPIFEKHPDFLASARRSADLRSFIEMDARFEKIIVGREVSLNKEDVLIAGALHAQLVVFPQDEAAAWQFKQYFEFYYPEGTLREFDSTFGRIITAEAYGFSWRLFNA